MATLSVRYPETTDTKHFRLCFHTFNDLGSGFFSDFLDRFDEFHFDRVMVNALDGVPVDFHIFGAQLRPQAQTRKTFSQIVKRNLEPDLAIMRNRLA